METRTSSIDDAQAMAYLMNLAVREAAQRSFQAMQQGKLNAGATVSIDAVKREDDGLVFSFVLWDTVHPNLRTDIKLTAYVIRDDTRLQEV